MPMPFFDRSNAKLPDELKDASQEELLEAVRFFKENKEKFSATATELETTKQNLANIEAQDKETKARLAAMEAELAAARQPPPSPTQPEAPTDFFTDPDKAFNQRQQPRDMIMLNTAAQVAQITFEGGLLNEPGRFGDDPKVYKKYQKEIADLMRREPLVNQTNPQAWKNAFLLIKGLHGDEISDARKNQDAVFFGETPRPAVAPEAKPVDEVTDDDRAAAKKYGITPEEVLSSRKSLKIMPMGQ